MSCRTEGAMGTSRRGVIYRRYDSPLLIRVYPDTNILVTYVFQPKKDLCSHREGRICSVTLASSNPLKPPLPVVILDPLPQPPLLQHRVIFLARPGRLEKITRPFPLAAAVVMVRGFMARAMNE